MAKKNRGGAANRTWKLLRMALLWTKKGGVLRRRLMMELRVVPKFIKNFKNSTSRDQLHYGERELSFDKTPIFHIKMHRPASMRFLIPCITPQADFDNDYGLDDDDYDQNYGYGTESYLKNDDQEEEEEEEEEESVAVEEEGIDSRAEKFIAKFYDQIKMQRQISYLEYNERLK
ncbi:hypothetical protein Dsin_025530 [Dipteronia sinensis]|uniref:Cotton fiber protein n=1 Tax=Dipteronia sinensis TaxID=43782 RepID=A0AAE0DWW6_9ROSI|nr:hypothetical protein Dsin_025530 [Dipteronia sinensis]